MDSANDSQFRPYQIVSPLGSGGMGGVYRAHDTRQRDVAIKRGKSLPPLRGGLRACCSTPRTPPACDFQKLEIPECRCAPLEANLLAALRAAVHAGGVQGATEFHGLQPWLQYDAAPRLFRGVQI